MAKAALSRLRGMERGLAEESGGVITLNPSYLPATLASQQQWVDLDARGNWKDYREIVDDSARIETRNVNGANAYYEIDPDGPPSDPQSCTSGCLASVVPKYDWVGNLTHEPLARVMGNDCDPPTPDCGSGIDIEYDSDNRVQRIWRNSNTAAGPYGGPTPETKLIEFVYDALGRRVETIEYVDPQTGAAWNGVGGNPQPRRTRHIYHGMEVVQEYVCTEGTAGCTDSADWALAREFVWGDEDRFPEPVAMIDHTCSTAAPGCESGSAVYHYLHDALGSVIGLVASGNPDGEGEDWSPPRVVERYTYDPYGKVFIESWTPYASNPNDGAYVVSAESNSGMAFSPLGNPWMWTGQRYDSAVGLYAFWARTYSPTLGRWLQRDPRG